VRGERVERPETVASAIRIGNPARWQEAVAALDASGGRITAVSDEQILAAQSWLAANEGVFCEPASAAAVAGALTERPEGERLVCVITGHGLKDPDVAIAHAPGVIACDVELAAVERAILG
jgi:threonine synthase